MTNAMINVWYINLCAEYEARCMYTFKYCRMLFDDVADTKLSCLLLKIYLLFQQS
jgi:Ni,Fe-hydrogenase I cytochrome b subunit